MDDAYWQREAEAEARRAVFRRAARFEDAVDRLIELRDELREAGRHEAADAVARALDALVEGRDAL